MIRTQRPRSGQRKTIKATRKVKNQHKADRPSFYGVMQIQQNQNRIQPKCKNQLTVVAAQARSGLKK